LLGKGGYDNMEKRNHHDGRNVLAFFLLTFLYSWLLWAPFVLSGFGVIEWSGTLEALRSPAVILGAFAPGLAAVTLVARRAGWGAVRQYLRQAFDLRGKAWYLAWALLLPLAVTAVTHYIANGTGLDHLDKSFVPAGLPVPTVVLAVAFFLGMMVAGGGQEEFGWRGYAQEPLQQRFGVVGGSLALGAVWGLWHLPLWYMPGEGHAVYPFLAFMLYIMSWALIMGWLYNAGGKKLIIPWLMHGMANTAVPLFPVVHMEGGAQPGYWLWAGMHSLVAVGLTIWFWRKREAWRVSKTGDEQGQVLSTAS
jgi:membrane protease YdiL (CAAX protease family)